MRLFSRRPVQKSRSREWLESLVSTVVFVWIFTNHIAQATEVPTESMVPTILPGDHFFLDKVVFSKRTIERGDIVAFWSPENRSLRLVKRVIGLPVEILEIRDRQVYIDGKPLDEPYKVHFDPNTYPRRDNLDQVTIPPGQYFMMGDNRDNSNDSRFWGFARREDFIGKPTFVYWSFETETATTDPSVSELLQHYAFVAEHFLSRTRWLRTGTRVH